MNIMKCVVIKVISEPERGLFGGYIVPVLYKIYDKELETILVFDYIEEAELVSIGYEFGDSGG